MNRRNFLSLAALAIAGKAAERVFPFRVYSIPKEIVIQAAPFDSCLLVSEHSRLIQEYTDSCSKAAMADFKENLRGYLYYQNYPRIEWNGLNREWVPTAPQSFRP